MRKLNAGELDDAILSSSPKVIGRYAEAARRARPLRVDSADWLFYLSLNPSRPPFDDVHVRRALSWLVDRAALRDAWGGPLAGSIARHYIPDDLLGGRLRLRAVRDSGRPRQRLAGQGRDGEVEVQDATRRLRRRSVQRVFLTRECDADRICGDLLYAASQRIVEILKPLTAKIGITLRSGGRSGWDLRLPASNIPISQSGYWRAPYLGRLGLRRPRLLERRDPSDAQPEHRRARDHACAGARARRRGQARGRSRRRRRPRPVRRPDRVAGSTATPRSTGS